MLNFLDVMEDWSREKAESEGLSVLLKFRRGRTDIWKISADLAFKTSVHLGVVIVWETGEVEAEVLRISTEERVLVVSTVLSDARELCDLLDRVLSVMLDG